jgi:hypothetical protein
MARQVNGLGNLDADGSTVGLTFLFNLDNVVVSAVGTFGSGTLTIQGSPDGIGWYDLTDEFDGSVLALTANGMARIVGDHPYIRATLVGATTPDVDVWIVKGD